MRCPATVTIILPEHPAFGAISDDVRCIRDTVCTDRHIGWLALPGTSVEWEERNTGKTFEIVGDMPGDGFIEFLAQERPAEV